MQTIKIAEPLSPSPCINKNLAKKKLYIESYGCQMNFSDSEIVAAILQDEGFENTNQEQEADVILLNTCAIRAKAEETIRKRLKQFQKIKQKKTLVIGILGCMAERLKAQLLEEEKIVDLVVGPDAYRDLPKLLEQVDDGRKAINTFLSREETYADINPVRLQSNGITAFISIMRGCDNMCSFCVVPFTRGRERSRDPKTIVKEATDLYHKGYKEITLLGQNVDSYKWKKEQAQKACNFAQLLEEVANIHPSLRIRFSTSHPKDITDEVLHTIKKYDNICNYIHLPVQSGNSRILKLMNRTYDRAWYLNKIKRIRSIIGNHCGISSDMIAGFCSETVEEHQDTLSLMKIVKYDFSYMFYYSERPGTLAARKYKDDVPLAEKKKRLSEIISLQRRHSLLSNQKDIGKIHRVLIEGNSKKSNNNFFGRNDTNKVIIFEKKIYKPGDYVNVLVDRCTSATLFGKIV